MTSLIPEEIDLGVLRRQLQDRFGDLPPAGYIRGKTALRDAVAQILKCSQVEAEQLVDTLETRGLIHYGGARRDGVDDLESTWILDA